LFYPFHLYRWHVTDRPKGARDNGEAVKEPRCTRFNLGAWCQSVIGARCHSLKRLGVKVTNAITDENGTFVVRRLLAVSNASLGISGLLNTII
jgi:hypothetical protein